MAEIWLGKKLPQYNLVDVSIFLNNSVDNVALLYALINGHYVWSADITNLLLEYSSVFTLVIVIALLDELHGKYKRQLLTQLCVNPRMGYFHLVV